jgi:hypothetical protein
MPRDTPAAPTTPAGRQLLDALHMRGIMVLDDGYFEDTDPRDAIRRIEAEARSTPAEALCDRIVNNGMGEPTECGRSWPCEYHDTPAEALDVLSNLVDAVTALENRSIRSGGEFHVWAEERMVTEARDEARAYLARSTPAEALDVRSERFRRAVVEVFNAPGEDWGPARGYYGRHIDHFIDMLDARLRSPESDR